MINLPTYSELQEQLSDVSDNPLRRQLNLWRKAIEDRSVSLREANDSANAEWDQANIALESAVSELEDAVRQWRLLKRESAPPSRLSEVNVRLLKADDRKTEAQEKLDGMGASRVEHARQRRARLVDLEIERAFSLIVSSLVDAMPGRREAINQGRDNAFKPNVDVIELDAFADKEERNKLGESLAREFLANPWAERLFLFGATGDLGGNLAIPFSESRYAGVYVCNYASNVSTSLFGLLLQHLMPSVTFSFFFRLKRAQKQQPTFPRGSKLSWQALPHEAPVREIHCDEVIETPSDLLEARLSGGSARLRDLEVTTNPRLEMPDGSLVYEKFRVPNLGGNLFCAGRYFPTGSERHRSHDLSRALLMWKRSGYPDAVVYSVVRFLIENVDEGAVISVVPDKPGKKPRNRELLQRCQQYFFSIEAEYYQWEPGLFSFKGSFETHRAGPYDERLELVSSNLVPGRTDLKGRKVLLIDDIFTSGATLKALISLLYNFMGAEQVECFCMARTVREHY